MVTPYMVPIERMRYTRQVATACSTGSQRFFQVKSASTDFIPRCSNAAMKLNRMLGFVIPSPTLAGMRKTRYFQLESWNCSIASKRFPNVISRVPTRTNCASFPQCDITKPAIKPPMGVASDGITRRSPAFDGVSRSTTWKNKGSIKRNWIVVQQRYGKDTLEKLTAYAAMPAKRFVIWAKTGSLPRSIHNGMMGTAVVRISTVAKRARRAVLPINRPKTHGLLHGKSFPPKLSPSS
jgi:hypothetical protein